MSEKRKDNRGRILRNGEIQENSGRYRYKYMDAFGDAKYVRSWRLDIHDPVCTFASTLKNRKNEYI